MEFRNLFKSLVLSLILIITFNSHNNYSFSQELSKEKKELDYIIKKVLEVDKKNRSYQARVSIYSKGFYEKGRKLENIKETRMSGFLRFKKPINILFKVEESQDPMALGATLLYTGGEKVHIRASGLLGLVKVSFNIDDPMFSNARNHKFSFDGLKNLKQGITNADLLGTIIRNGKKNYILKIIPIIKADPEITHEIYFVEIDTFRVSCIEMYVNKEMVSQYNIKDMKSNFVINESDIFRL